MVITNKINIDLARLGVQQLLHAVQNDANSRVVEISLLENGTAWNVPDGATAAMAYRKADGTSGLYDTLPGGQPAYSITGNVVSFILAPQMLTVPGVVLASVVLTKDSVRLSTFAFSVGVERDLDMGGGESEDYYYYSVFEGVIADVAKLKETVDQIVVLPKVTKDDNGKMLQVVDGVWTVVDDTQRVTDIVNAVLEEALGGDY